MITQKFIITLLLLLQFTGNGQKSDTTVTVEISAQDTTDIRVDYENTPSMIELRKQNSGGNRRIAEYIDALKVANAKRAKENAALKQELLQYRKQVVALKAQPHLFDTIVKYGIPILEKTVYKGLIPNPDLPSKKQKKAAVQARELFIEIIQKEELDTVRFDWTYYKLNRM